MHFHLLDLQPNMSHLHEVCVFCVPDGDQSVNFFDQFLLLVVIKVHVPFGQTRLASAVLDQDKSDLLQTKHESIAVSFTETTDEATTFTHHFDLVKQRWRRQTRVRDPGNSPRFPLLPLPRKIFFVPTLSPVGEYNAGLFPDQQHIEYCSLRF